MKIDVLATGSSGNCCMIQADGLPPLLLDAGISMRDIERRSGYRIGEVAGCLVSHGHSDHVKSVGKLAARCIDIYASWQTLTAVNLHSAFAHPVTEHETFVIKGYSVYPFEAEHDADGTLGYVISAGDERLMYLTDSFYCKYKFTKLTHVMIECNYINAVLKTNIESGIIELARADRLYSSHMSLENLVEFFNENDRSALREVYLLHMSEDNSDEAAMIRAIKEATGAEVYAAQKNGGINNAESQ